MIATETLEPIKLEQETAMPEQLDLNAAYNMMAESGYDIVALQTKVEDLIAHPEKFLELMEEFETMKAESLSAIIEWWCKVNAAGREKLLAGLELLKFTKLALETFAGDLLIAAREAGSEGKEIAAGVLMALLRRKGFATVIAIIALIVISCTTFPPAVKTAFAPDVAFASGLTVTASVEPPQTGEPSATPKPTKEKPPTKSATPKPPASATPKPTETEATLTARQREFLDQGFDKLCSLENGEIYGILDESSIEYMADGGVKIGGEKFGEGGNALSTAEVTYYNPETKQFETGKFVIDWAIETGFGDKTYVTYPVETGSVGVDPIILPQRLVKDHREQYFDFNKGPTPFIKLTFKSSGLDEEILESFFDGVFPDFKGKITSITIPGIGKVLAVRGALIEGYPNWEY